MSFIFGKSGLIFFYFLTISLGKLPGYDPTHCDKRIKDALEHVKNDPNAFELYPKISEVTGVTVNEATYEDFQRYFKCQKVHRFECNDKGLPFPKRCSQPPCFWCPANKHSK